MLLIVCLFLLPLFSDGSMFILCFVVLLRSVVSSFLIISLRKRHLVALL